MANNSDIFNCTDAGFYSVPFFPTTVTVSFVPYTVQVFASTMAGRGDPFSAVIFTGHGGQFCNLYYSFMIAYLCKPLAYFAACLIYSY